MSSPGPRPSAGPSRVVKWIVSIVILWQFFAIVTIVVAGGTERFPSPPPAVWLFQNVHKRQLQGLYLTNPYRFYAPDPGPTDVIWYRLEYENGGVRWHDLADRDSFFNRMPYQRHMSLNMMVGNAVNQDPNFPRGRIMAPQALIFVQSYARHVAAVDAAVTPDGQPNPVKEVEIYHLRHLIAEPQQIRLGWDGWDIRLFRPVYLGAYDADGKRTDVEPRRELQGVSQPMSSLAAQILKDCSDTLSLYPKSERPAVADRLRASLPRTFRDLLDKNPELIDPDQVPNDWVEHIREVVERHDDPEFRRRMTSQQREALRDW